MHKKFNKIQLFAVLVLIMLIAVQGLISINSYSLTSDETCYLGVGKAIVETGNFRINVPVYHPPLSFYIGSIFLLPLDMDKEILQSYECWEIGKNVAFNSGYDPGKIIFLSRLPFVFLSIILGLWVLRWATQLYGPMSGLFAFFVYSFNPSIIAYSSITTTDFTVAAMFFIASYYFWKLIKSPSKSSLILSGVFFGLALLSKVTAVLLVPLFLIVGLVAVYKKDSKLRMKTFIRDLLIIFSIAYLVIFLFFGFQFDTLSNSLAPGHFSDKVERELSKSAIFPDELLYVYKKLPIPTPSYWAEVGGMFYLSVQSNSGYVFGKITDGIAWYYVYVTFFLKTGIPILIFLFLLFLMRRRLPKKDLITNLVLWLPILLLLVNFSFTNKMSGVRHILIFYPFISVLISNVINAKLKRRGLFFIFVGVLLFYYSLSAFFVSPHYIAYVNEFGGGPENAYNIMVGSNIDQGQDLKGLKKYIEDHNIEKIKLSYFGNTNPADYGISYEYLPSPSFLYWVPDYTLLRIEERGEDCSERKGIIAISVTNLKSVHMINKHCYDWLSKYEPVEMIGRSILIYDIK